MVAAPVQLLSTFLSFSFPDQCRHRSSSCPSFEVHLERERETEKEEKRRILALLDRRKEEKEGRKTRKKRERSKFKLHREEGGKDGKDVFCCSLKLQMTPRKEGGREKRHLTSLFWIWQFTSVHSFISPLSLSCFPGPPRAREKEVHEVALLGSDLRLACPITGSAPLMVEWFRGGEAIDDHTWERFKPSKKGGLRVRDVDREDDGVYVCKATNGFGSEDVSIKLIVIGE